MNNVVPLPVTSAALPVTEDSLARELARKLADEAKYEHRSGRWYFWNGAYWCLDEKGRAKEEVRGIYAAHSAHNEQIAKTFGRKSAIDGIENLARSDDLLAATSDEFDRDPWLLGTPGGTVDFKPGEIGPAEPSDLITKSTRVSPVDTEPKIWLKFLGEACNGDMELVRYLQRVAGYCLTGLTIEHKLFFVFGPGGNGKSVFLNTIAGIMGDYAKTAPMDTFTASRGDRHPTELAMLQGARLVTASETEEGQAWAESKIKQLTGGDTISARFMRRDFFEYKPQFKLVIAGNHKPVLRNVDEAARRRFHLVPFVVKPKEPDKDLEHKLRSEWPLILQWMIEGCIEWQAENELEMPETVRNETEGYFDDQDIIAQWLRQRCEVDEMPISPATQTRCLSSKLYSSYSDYCRKAGEDEGSNRALTQQLVRRGFLKKRTMHGAEFAGIRLAPDNQDMTL